MDLHHLRVFRSAARSASFTAAGRELLLSQSTVSLHIKHLEAEFGAALFIRSRKRVALSEAGQVLLTHVDRIFAELQSAEQALHEFSGLKRGTIRFGVGATTLTYLLPPVLAKFRKKYPDIEVMITTGTTEAMLDMLLANMLDLAIVTAPSAELENVQNIFLQQEKLVVALSPESPLVAKAELEPADLEKLPWISHMRGTAMETVQSNFFSQIGIQPSFSMEMENMEAIKSLVRQGLGVSLLPLCAVLPEVGRGVVTRDVQGVNLYRELVLSAVDWRAQPPATRRFARRIVRALSDKNSVEEATALIEQVNGADEPFEVASRGASS